MRYQGKSRPKDWEGVRDFLIYDSESLYKDDEIEFYFELGATAMLDAIEKAIQDKDFTPSTITNCLNDYGLNIWIEEINNR